MSYILDALKKAERERDIAQVPTLSTVHDLRAKPPIRLWAASGIVVLCAAVFVLLFFFGLDAEDEVKPSLAEGADNLASRPEQLKEPAPVDEAPVSIRPSESRATPDFGYSRETPALADEAGMEMTDRGKQEPMMDERRAVQSNRATTSSRAATVPSSGEDTSQSPPQELTELPLPEPKGEAAGVEEPKPSADAAGEGGISLRDAMDKMTMSILLYSENKAERLVFINGRKYVEGDTIEGNYLLESIAPDGAVISYNGERAMLRPDRN